MLIISDERYIFKLSEVGMELSAVNYSTNYEGYKTCLLSNLQLSYLIPISKIPIYSKIPISKAPTMSDSEQEPDQNQTKIKEETERKTGDLVFFKEQLRLIIRNNRQSTWRKEEHAKARNKQRFLAQVIYHSYPTMVPV